MDPEKIALPPDAVAARADRGNPGHRRIVLCADDFGMNPCINAGILDLAHRGRLSATSVLVDGPAVGQDMAALRDAPLQIGLHLNFTESFGQPGLCLPLRKLIAAALLRRLPVAALHDGVQRQLTRFHALTGRWPDYVDGHQHVHQLPGIREALLQALGPCGSARFWIRDTGRPRLAGLPLRLQFKALVIARLGAAGLRRQALADGHRLNPGFLGVYDFQGGTTSYARWMRYWLALCQDDDVLMCHPALGSWPGDPLSPQRQAEHEVLAGPLMGRLLAENGLRIAGAAPRTKEFT